MADACVDCKRIEPDTFGHAADCLIGSLRQQLAAAQTAEHEARGLYRNALDGVRRWLAYAAEVEKERNEARAEVSQWRADCCKARDERDAARAALARLVKVTNEVLDTERHDWRAWDEWARKVLREALPASPEPVASAACPICLTTRCLWEHRPPCDVAGCQAGPYAHESHETEPAPSGEPVDACDICQRVGAPQGSCGLCCAERERADKDEPVGAVAAERFAVLVCGRRIDQTDYTRAEAEAEAERRRALGWRMGVEPVGGGTGKGEG